MICRDCKKELEDDESLRIEKSFKLETDSLDQEFHQEFYLCQKCLINFMEKITGEEKCL